MIKICHKVFFLEYNEIMEKIAIVGYRGKMGRLITDALKDDYLCVGVGRNDNLEDFQDVDLVIDFASHESSVKSAEFCLLRKIPIIIGSTGQTEAENNRIEEISKKIKVARHANFSRGIEILKAFVDGAVTLSPEKFEIVEKHHIHKKDKPSGTAIELQAYIARRFGGEIEIKSIREGEEMGEHEIIAYLSDENLSIKHNVYSRKVFVLGVEKAVKELLKSAKH